MGGMGWDAGSGERSVNDPVLFGNSLFGNRRYSFSGLFFKTRKPTINKNKIIYGCTANLEKGVSKRGPYLFLNCWSVSYFRVCFIV